MKNLLDGLYIFTREEIIEEQKDWHDEDSSKEIDFTTSPLWLVTDDGVTDPVGVDNKTELKNILKGIK